MQSVDWLILCFVYMNNSLTNVLFHTFYSSATILKKCLSQFIVGGYIITTLDTPMTLLAKKKCKSLRQDSIGKQKERAINCMKKECMVVSKRKYRRLELCIGEYYNERGTQMSIIYIVIDT